MTCTYTAKMPTILLVRHGQSTANHAGILAGRHDGVDLTETGKRQARTISERVGSLPIVRVVVSPLLRCQQTATLAFPTARTVTDDRANECDYGAWTGRPLTGLIHEPVWTQIQKAPLEVTFPEGESFTDMFARVDQCLRDHDREILAEYGDNAIWAFVSHGDPIKAAIATQIGLPSNRFQRLMIHPGSVSVLHSSTESSALISWNSLAGPLQDLVPKAPPAELGGSTGTEML